VRRSSRLRGEQEFQGALAHFRRHNGKDSVKGIRGEQAAIDAAVKVGAQSARVMVETVVNSRWQNRLEALGYTKLVIPHSGGEFGFQAVMSRVFPVSQR
jgi:hypothetical protein